jgi:hypothetical protein
VLRGAGGGGGRKEPLDAVRDRAFENTWERPLHRHVLRRRTRENRQTVEAREETERGTLEIRNVLGSIKDEATEKYIQGSADGVFFRR